ncbi:MAG: hypothetical protein ACQETE_09100 [Bacteroidota bacterium]
MASSSQQQQKSKVLRPNWKHFFWRYLAAVLFIPVFGLGIIALWWIWRKQHQYRYLITDQSIELQDQNYSERIDLENIQSVRVKQRWIDQKTKVGILEIITPDRRATLLGQPHPRELADMIKKAAAHRRRLLKEKEKSAPRQPETSPGEMERVNYLTGLWQQGLLSNEEYKRQRKQS